MELESLGFGYLETLDSIEPPRREGVVIPMPYGDREFKLSYSDNELDKLLLTGVSKVLAGKCLDDFDYITKLGAPHLSELPVWVGVRALELNAKSRGLNEARLEFGITTQSHSNEHRGTAITERNWDNSWSLLAYNVAPPLRDPSIVKL